MSEGHPIVGLGSISVDCPDPLELASFYARLLGGTVEIVGDGYACLSFGGTWINCLAVADYAAPTWPSPRVPAQLHLDFSVDDLEAATRHAVAAGATVAETQPDPDSWRVLLDPVGHPFCLSLNRAED